MKTLDECRKELNALDDELKELFLKRMAIVKEVSAYKREKGLPVYDPQREASMKERLSCDLDSQMKVWYLEFLDTILKVSKDMQSKSGD